LTVNENIKEKLTPEFLYGFFSFEKNKQKDKMNLSNIYFLQNDFLLMEKHEKISLQKKTDSHLFYSGSSCGECFIKFISIP